MQEHQRVTRALFVHQGTLCMHALAFFSGEAIEAIRSIEGAGRCKTGLSMSLRRMHMLRSFRMHSPPERVQEEKGTAKAEEQEAGNSSVGP